MYIDTDWYLIEARTFPYYVLELMNKQWHKSPGKIFQHMNTMEILIYAQRWKYLALSMKE